MNNSTIDTDNLLLLINSEKTNLLLPAIIYVSILMVTGLLGNLMVCYFYGHKSKTTPSTIFIVSLGIYDLTVCCIFMPTEIVDLVKFYTFDNGVACKILRFVNFFTGVGSILTLLAIAVDRYKHIHKASSQQITLKGTKVICVVVATVAVVLSWPSLLIYDSLPIEVPNKFGVNLNGSNCMLSNQPSYRPYVWAFNAVQFLCFIIFTTVLVVLYGIVGQTIYKHRKRMSRYKLTTSITATKELENSTSTGTVPSDELSSSLRSESIQTEVFENTSRNVRSEPLSGQSHDNDCSFFNGVENRTRTDLPGQSSLSNHGNQSSSSCHHGNQIDHRPLGESCELTNVPFQENIEKKDTTTLQMRSNRLNTRTRSKGQGRDTLNFDREAVQVTLVMIAVTVLFIISLLPYLCLTVWRIYEGKHEAEFLSDMGLVAFKIGSRSYLLNSSLNPWIYGIFNSKFRLYYYQTFCCRTK